MAGWQFARGAIALEVAATSAALLHENALHAFSGQGPFQIATDASKLKGRAAYNEAERLNKDCFCVTLDHGMLAEAPDREVGVLIITSLIVRT